ncbi:DivIVA domain-containing protein [Desertivibrio insolitus]|uniref:DivIVA domain-containing protein n=1 Tax=Herbiconiux sp. SYSU D00978 TaxID=2812562 RepID=UPI001A97B6B4|nr:DivIVA domain-containing protein [Herbiconiux sp. SYSU D00978]
MGRVSTFPRVRKSRLGYDVAEVEAFLEEARRAYTTERGQSASLDAERIRRTAFGMQKGGFSTTHVDAALERLEDAFSARERERALATRGDAAWYAHAREVAQDVLDRLARPRGERFDRAGLLTTGYNRREVDLFGDRLVRYFQDGRAMSIEEVRTVAFRPQKNGYREAQVDLLLDAVVDVMLAVR